MYVDFSVSPARGVRMLVPDLYHPTSIVSSSALATCSSCLRLTTSCLILRLSSWRPQLDGFAGFCWLADLANLLCCCCCMRMWGMTGCAGLQDRKLLRLKCTMGRLIDRRLQIGRPKSQLCHLIDISSCWLVFDVFEHGSRPLMRAHLSQNSVLSGRCRDDLICLGTCQCCLPLTNLQNSGGDHTTCATCC